MKNEGWSQKLTCAYFATFLSVRLSFSLSPSFYRELASKELIRVGSKIEV